MPRVSATMGMDTTVWPGVTPKAPGPTSSTSAANSWPITTSSAGSKMLIDMPSLAAWADSVERRTIWSAFSTVCRSDPQMPHARVCTSTCPSPGMGSGTSSTTMRAARSTAAFTTTAVSFRLLFHFDCCFISTAVSFRLLFFGVLLDGLHDGGARPAHELGPVGDGPVARLDQGAGRVLQRRHDVAGEEFVRPQCRFRVGPVVGEQ